MRGLSAVTVWQRAPLHKSAWAVKSTPTKKREKEKKRNVSLTKHPHSCCYRRIQTPCNSLITATLSRLWLFRRQISMQPERQTLAVNLNPNRSLEITRFDHDFLCLQPVLLGAASKSFHYIFNKMYLEYKLKSSYCRSCNWKTNISIIICKTLVSYTQLWHVWVC